VFDERWSIHGSTNGNVRSLEDDKEFELVVLVDDEAFARSVLEGVLTWLEHCTLSIRPHLLCEAIAAAAG
jgi:phosphatidylserine/phosphatidylglycerophosphate/cardiolipin synthase-like enzyme